VSALLTTAACLPQIPTTRFGFEVIPKDIAFYLPAFCLLLVVGEFLSLSFSHLCSKHKHDKKWGSIRTLGRRILADANVQRYGITITANASFVNGESFWIHGRTSGSSPNLSRVCWRTGHYHNQAATTRVTPLNWHVPPYLAPALG
jgi:hypothetical protein